MHFLGMRLPLFLKAIIDSKLGQDLSYSGFSYGGLEAGFRVSIMGSEPDRADLFLQLVMKTLEEISNKPIEKKYRYLCFSANGL